MCQTLDQAADNGGLLILQASLAGHWTSHGNTTRIGLPLTPRMTVGPNTGATYGMKNSLPEPCLNNYEHYVAGTHDQRRPAQHSAHLAEMSFVGVLGFSWATQNQKVSRKTSFHKLTLSQTRQGFLLTSPQ